MKKYEDPKLNIQEFDKSTLITMSDPHQLVNGLENGDHDTIIQVSYKEIIAFTE